MRGEALLQAATDPLPGRSEGWERGRQISPRALAGMFVVLSACVSLAILALRNIYDDELMTLYLASGHVKEILAVSAEGDVHPPGMYLVGHAGWMLTHSYRWLNLVPWAMLYAGLAYFLGKVAPLVRSRGGQVCLLLLATLHPELLMWSNTFRWYCPWTGLALITLTAALQPGRAERVMSVRRGVLLGCLLGGMFYLNYLTLLFAPVLLVALLVEYRGDERRALLRAAVAAAGVSGLVAAPQVRTMVVVHLASGPAQRYGMGLSVVRLVQALGESEAFLPWHPLAMVVLVVVGALLLVGVVAWVRRGRAEAPGWERGTAGLVVFAVLFLMLVGLSGLGGKPRSGLVLVPVLAPVAAFGMERLGRRLQLGVLLLLAVWSFVGAAHLLGRHGLLKAGMNDRPEDVVAFIQQRIGHESLARGVCGVVVTYDPELAFRVAQYGGPGLRVVSPYGGDVFGATAADLPAECMHPLLFVVESYIEGDPVYVQTYTSEMHAAERFVGSPSAIERMVPDPDAPRKRRLGGIAGMSSAARLPDFRDVVVWGTMDRGSYRAMLGELPHFYGVQD